MQWLVPKIISLQKESQWYLYEPPGVTDAHGEQRQDQLVWSHRNVGFDWKVSEHRVYCSLPKDRSVCPCRHQQQHLECRPVGIRTARTSKIWFCVDRQVGVCHNEILPKCRVYFNSHLPPHPLLWQQYSLMAVAVFIRKMAFTSNVPISQSDWASVRCAGQTSLIHWGFTSQITGLKRCAAKVLVPATTAQVVWTLYLDESELF